MLLSRIIADFTRGESDALRKAMGKKLIDKLNHMYPKFIAGGTANGYDPKKLEKIWDDWRAFASYAFNKSHATCYSWVAYQTAYLKANFPSQYMAAVMSRSLENIKDITKLMDECKAIRVKTLGPDINESMLKFSVNRMGDIRFGMGAIKGVGEAAVQAIIDERDKNGMFKSIYDFMERINLSACNRKCMESLALAGAFDGFAPICREQYFATNERGEVFLDSLIKYGQKYQCDTAFAGATLFGDIEEIEISHPEPPAQFRPWSDLERLNKERDLIGIYISGHPLDEFQIVLENVCNLKAIDLEDLNGHVNMDVSLGGIITELREGITKTGKPYGIVKIEDYSGSGEIALFGQDWATWSGYLRIGNSVFITGRTEPHRFKMNTVDLRIGKIEFLTDVKDRVIEKITIKINLHELTESLANELATIIAENPGSTPLYFHINQMEEQTYVTLHSKAYKVSINKSFISYLENTPILSFKIN